ncbi:EAL domain-containing protein [Sphingomonas sp. BK481]|uniref:EAL domain-containing protein n=1 Tax=Sphingomonas sp. BK481 TaxID=2586981 RepID=UPI00160EBBB5|nr:EAL domain-containing protein [Sphingomonas sp. BK481]MBB3589364.1 EAL domain-containing protein (putative c-di-GMP-specific phosphodiesterase class I) [Sphingomonas sp. BK481]
MHFSISTKVTAACAAVLVPSLLLLASGLEIGAEVGAANEHIGHLSQLQVAGAIISMDDFGTGHSSLSNLNEFSFDKLKIDRSFVATMLSHAPSAVIVKATIGLGRSLGMSIVAEGVETALQLKQLREWGCDQVQGYYIGRPVPQVAEVLNGR